MSDWLVVAFLVALGGVTAAGYLALARFAAVTAREKADFQATLLRDFRKSGDRQMEALSQIQAERQMEREQFLDAIFAKTAAELGALRRGRNIPPDALGEAEIARAGGPSMRDLYRSAGNPVPFDEPGDPIVPVGMGG